MQAAAMLQDSSRILFVSIGHPGQLNPLLAIAQSLCERRPDLDIGFASSADLRAQIEKVGLSFIPIWSTSKLPKDMVSFFNISGIRSVEAMRQYTEWTRGSDNYDEPRALLLRTIQEYKPLLVVCDVLSEAGMAAAREVGVPYVINSPLPPYTCFPDSLPKIFPPVGSGTSLYKTSMWHRVYDLVVAARYGLGLVRHVVPLIENHHRVKGIPRPEEFASDARLFLNDTSEHLSDPRVDWPRDKIQWIGASLPKQDSDLAQADHFAATWRQHKQGSADDLYDWIDQAAASPEPLIFLALGTLYQLDAERVLTIYDALSSLPVKVLWKLSKEHQQALKQKRPDIDMQDFRFEAWIPSIPLVLAHHGVKLFINHAGGNSLHEGLFFGKRMVCLPAWMDCFDFAMRCQDAGAGLTIDTAPKLDRDQLKDAVRRVLLDEVQSPIFAANAERVSRGLRSLGGANEAAAAIERLLLGEPVVQNRAVDAQCEEEKHILQRSDSGLFLGYPI